MSNRGFTLVELSVVMIVIAAIVSAIFLASNIIMQAKVRRLVIEMNQYQTAIDNFRDQYHAVPGDFAQAFNIWGTQCAASAAACNGNGNHIIEWSNSTTGVESLLAWRHLTLAQLIPGSYPGSATVSGQSDIGINIPSSIFSGAGVELYTQATTPSGNQGLSMQIAGATANSWANSANVMTPKEAMAVDIKIDDGVGKTGSIQGFNSGSANTCIGTDNLNYNTSLSQRVCFIRFALIWP